MLPTTQYSSQKYNLRFWLWDPKWNLQFATVKNPWKQTWKPKTWWLGSMFLLGTRAFFRVFVSRTSVPRWLWRTWQMWEASAHEKPEKENQKPTPERRVETFGHIFLGWKLKIASDSFKFWNESSVGDVLFEVVTDFDMCLPWFFGISLLQMMGLSTPTPIFWACVSFNEMVGNINSACTYLNVENFSQLQNHLHKSLDLVSITHKKADDFITLSPNQVRLTPAPLKGYSMQNPLIDKWSTYFSIFRVILEWYWEVGHHTTNEITRITMAQEFDPLPIPTPTTSTPHIPIPTWMGVIFWTKKPSNIPKPTTRGHSTTNPNNALPLR